MPTQVPASGLPFPTTPEAGEVERELPSPSIPTARGSGLRVMELLRLRVKDVDVVTKAP